MKAGGCYICDCMLDGGQAGFGASDMCRACGLAFVKEFGCSSGNTERWIAKRVWSFARKLQGSTPRRPKVLARYADPKDKLSPVLVWSDMRSRWVEGHFSVMLADCPRCSAKKGTPCYGVAGTMTGTHYVRKHKARPARLKLLQWIGTRMGAPRSP